MPSDHDRRVGMAYIGQRMPRREDYRLIRGEGHYVSDISLPNMVHMAVVRSVYAHADITGLDLTRARAMPGVLAVLGPDDIPEIMTDASESGRVDPRAVPVLPTPLARRRVLFVGDAIAVVLASNAYLAEDAAHAVRVEYQEREPIVHAKEALSMSPMHPTLQNNLAGTAHYRVGDGRDALDSADVVVKIKLRLGRVVAHPMEPRGVVAQYDDARQRFTVYAGTQGVHGYRDGLAHILGVPLEAIRVVSPDTGGAFGVKNRVYPEDVLATYCARRFGRPVKWMGDRREEFISTNQERDQWHEAAIGITSQGTIVAVTDDFIQDQGAFLPSGILVADTTAISIPGPYKVPHFEAKGDTVYTNKVPVGPYRGAGRPQGTFVMERLLDAAADRLGMDRVEIRRRNLVSPSDMPYFNGLEARGQAMRQDRGDYGQCMELVLADVEQGGDEAPEGWYIGTAVANYLEMSGGVGFEGAGLRLLQDGRVEVVSGVSFQGQGHETTFSQIAADRLELPIEQVVVNEGDTAAIERGVGTFGSRSVIMAGNAIRIAAMSFRDAIRSKAASMLEASLEDVVWHPGGQLAVNGVPARTVNLVDVAQFVDQHNGQAIAVEEYYSAQGPTYGMGSHGVRLAVDPETFAIRILRYCIRHDAGVVVNPLLAEGQTIGATIQGLGTALWEELHFDPQSGQPINATFLDYFLPTSDLSPDVWIHELPSPEDSNPEGFKGLAEGGIMPPMAAICSALEDALRPLKVSIEAIPVTPNALFGQVLERRSKG